MITPDDITDEMEKWFDETADTEDGSLKEIIAAAVNAYLPQDDDIDLNEDWLIDVAKYQYVDNSLTYLRSPSVEDKNAPSLVLTISSERVLHASVMERQDVFGDREIGVDIQTRGQLRAWHKAFRQELREV